MVVTGKRSRGKGCGRLDSRAQNWTVHDRTGQDRVPIIMTDSKAYELRVSGILRDKARTSSAMCFDGRGGLDLAGT